MLPRHECDFVHVYLKLSGILIFKCDISFIQVDQVSPEFLDLGEKLRLTHLLQDFKVPTRIYLQELLVDLSESCVE